MINEFIVSDKQAELYYECVHDLNKAMLYLNVVAAFECSLDLAVASLEAKSEGFLAQVEKRHGERAK